MFIPLPKVELMRTDLSNIFAGIPALLSDELFEIILENDAIRIERIVSRGHITAEGHWYDQAWDEWVLLLQGRAALCYENTTKPAMLNPGDYCLIPAHTRHRVAWTDPDQDTIWLAVHMNKNK